MSSSVPPPDGDVFAVPYNADRGNQSATLASGLGAVSAVLATVLGLILSGVTWWLALQDGAGAGLVLTALVVTVAMAIIVSTAWRPVRAAARNRANLAKARDAMQISAAGVGFPDLDTGGWIVVPWPMITGARVMSWRSVRFLHLELSPDLHPSQPGVQGLDRPGALRALMRPTMGMVGPRFSLAVLQRSSDEIDAALRHYSDGRIFLT